MIGANPRSSAAINLMLSTQLMTDLTKIGLLGQAYVQANSTGDLEAAAKCAEEAVKMDKVLSHPNVYLLPIAGQA